MPSDPGPYIECAKCGDRIRSKHRRDFRTCRCKATFVDGGNVYLRVGGHPRMKDGRIEVFNAK